jgi:predicted nucleotidyltransferase component of viral defense system
MMQANKPGIKDSLYLKEELMKEFLRYFYKSDNRDKLVLQGGGALHFVYSSPRYSIDLDFVMPEPSTPIDSLKLEEMIQDYKYPVNYAVKKETDKLTRSCLYLEFDSQKRLALNIEICRVTPAYPCWKKTELGDFFVEPPYEIMTDKIVAGIGRMNKDFIKTHDIFDMYYILTNFNAKQDKELFFKKMGDYKLKDTKPLEKVIEWLNDSNLKEFTVSLEGFLPFSELKKVEPKKIFDEVKNYLVFYKKELNL